MRHNYYIVLFFVLICILLSSCTTSQRILINGVPGTEIYSPDMEKLGVIEDKGKVKIKVSSDSYYAYLLSHQPDSGQLVPFALDYRRKSYIGTQVSKWMGCTITAAGGLMELIGLAAVLGGDEEVGEPFLIGGLPVMGLGTAIGTAAIYRSSQTQYEYQFKYLSSQSTNQDLHFVPIVDTGIKKADLSTAGNLGPESKQEASGSLETTSSAARRKASSSSRTLKDFAKTISGTYIGKGSLTRLDNIAETYDKVKIVINRIDRNTVSVDVVESGESFFNSKLKYTIKRTETGYTLNMKDIPSAVINIDVQGGVSYYHPKVNIDGDIYTLEIVAKKQ